MNFFLKISPRSSVGRGVFSAFAAVFIGAAAIAIEPSVIMAQSSAEQVCARAKQFTVLIKGSQGTNGSGVIYKKDGNSYFVLTNYHVVGEKDSYQIQTPDGNRYALEYAKEATGYDLAVLGFKSDRPYAVAQFGNSQEMNEGARVYATGFPGNRPGIEVPAFSCTTGQIDSRLATGNQGYTMVYSNQIIPGMSGGPVLDESSRLVGVNGRAIPINEKGSSLGALRLWIPIDTLSRVASWQPLPLQLASSNPPNRVAPKPSPPRPIPTSGGLPTGAVERQNPNVPGLTSEQVNIILTDLYKQYRRPVPCNVAGVLRDNSIEGVRGYTVCFLPVSN